MKTFSASLGTSLVSESSLRGDGEREGKRGREVVESAVGVGGRGRGVDGAGLRGGRTRVCLLVSKLIEESYSLGLRAPAPLDSRSVLPLSANRLLLRAIPFSQRCRLHLASVLPARTSYHPIHLGL
jgi:hypothetical protein